jgi:hypothetical protein
MMDAVVVHGTARCGGEQKRPFHGKFMRFMRLLACYGSHSLKVRVVRRTWARQIVVPVVNAVWDVESLTGGNAP